jgi:hypothetical protein
MSTRLYRDLFHHITKYTPSPDNSGYFLLTVHFSDNHMLTTRPNVWPGQVTIHRTVEVGLDTQCVDEEQPRGNYVQTHTVRSQAELEMIAAELQMKNDLQI